MILPGAERALIEAAKVRDYLLSASHPIGRHKAAFFARLGYTGANWDALRDALRHSVRTNEAALGRLSPFGVMFEVRATLGGPSGRSAPIVTIWILKWGEDFPRFVTAIPG